MACPKCGYLVRDWRIPLESTGTYLFSRYSRCIQCGSFRVRRLSGRDRIDGRSGNLLSLLLSLTFAPFYHCNSCRLQYHDWRPVHPTAHADSRSAQAGLEQS